MTFVCRLLAARWITVWPRVSFELIWAPRETKHWTASKAPDVVASNNGVDLRLEFRLFQVEIKSKVYLSSVVCSSNSGCLL